MLLQLGRCWVFRIDGLILTLLTDFRLRTLYSPNQGMTGIGWGTKEIPAEPEKGLPGVPRGLPVIMVAVIKFLVRNEIMFHVDPDNHGILDMLLGSDLCRNLEQVCNFDLLCLTPIPPLFVVEPFVQACMTS